MASAMPGAASVQELARCPDEELDLALGALLLARELAYPDLNVGVWLRLLDELAEGARGQLAIADARERLLRLNRAVFEQYGFRGNIVDYYDPRNNYLNDVLQRRLGLPITLALVAMEIGRRAGCELYGIGLPGHFVLCAAAGGERLYFDPFSGGRALDMPGLMQLVKPGDDSVAMFDSAWLQPLGRRQILARISANLQSVYVMNQDWPRAILATERLFWLGGEAGTLRDLGYLCVQAGELKRAASALESYLHTAPDAEDARTVQDSLTAVYQRLALLG